MSSEATQTTVLHSESSSRVEEIDLEWEEWDGKSPFLHHCIAGSIAGVAEHTLLYPVDTVKTHMQAHCAECPNNPNRTPSLNAKKVCTGPPSKAAAVSTANSSSFQLSSVAKAISISPNKPPPTTSSQTVVPHGMWSTMRNLVQHGHALHDVLPPLHNNNATRSRRSATLSIPSSTDLTNATKSKSSSTTNKGFSRLWRGVQTMAVGCIPAHALYFSTYEYCKSKLSTTISHDSANDHPTDTQTQQHQQHTYLAPLGASIVGAASTFSHDLIMTPLDTIKQRMQLGHYSGMGSAFSQIVRLEGWNGLYRSFGVTLLTNLPYGMVMMSTNEFLRDLILHWKDGENVGDGNYNNGGGGGGGGVHTLDMTTTLISGCGAGMTAAALTSPLDRVKTRLQTQRLGTALPNCPKLKTNVRQQVQYNGVMDALESIVREEGPMGLWRGLVPRLMTHAPAVAISWTSYEAAKKWLASLDS